MRLGKIDKGTSDRHLMCLPWQMSPILQALGWYLTCLPSLAEAFIAWAAASASLASLRRPAAACIMVCMRMEGSCNSLCCPGWPQLGLHHCSLMAALMILNAERDIKGSAQHISLT